MNAQKQNEFKNILIYNIPLTGKIQLGCFGTLTTIATLFRFSFALIKGKNIIWLHFS